MRNGGIQVAFVVVLIGFCAPAHAIGWDSDDFLIGGGPSFSTRIGVFEHDLTFKGYLDSNFPTVSGLDFDDAGRLVAVGSNSSGQKVRVYDSTGALVGGFTRRDDLLGTAGDLKVAPSGNYVVATQNFGGGDGTREFSPNGAFVRQLGSGWIRGAVVLPGNLLWTGGVSSTGVSVFDLSTGNSLGSIPIVGLSGVNSMTYSAVTDSVLIATLQSNAILETDLAGNVIHTFGLAGPAQFNAVTRGPGGVFATRDNSVFRWHADGTFVGQTSLQSSLGFVGHMVWAANVPEPTGALIVVVCAAMGLGRTSRRIRSRSLSF